MRLPNGQLLKRLLMRLTVSGLCVGVLQPDKDRELLQQNVHMTQVMFEQAKEDFEVC